MNRDHSPLPTQTILCSASASNKSGVRPHPPALPVRSSGTNGHSPPRTASLLVTSHGRLTAEGEKEKGEGGQRSCPPSPKNHFPLPRPGTQVEVDPVEAGGGAVRPEGSYGGHRGPIAPDVLTGVRAKHTTSADRLNPRWMMVLHSDLFSRYGSRGPR